MTFDDRGSFNQQQHMLLARDNQLIRALFTDEVFGVLWRRSPRSAIESRGRDALLYRFEKLPDRTPYPGFWRMHWRCWIYFSVNDPHWLVIAKVVP